MADGIRVELFWKLDHEVTAGIDGVASGVLKRVFDVAGGRKFPGTA